MLPLRSCLSSQKPIPLLPGRPNGMKKGEGVIQAPKLSPLKPETSLKKICPLGSRKVLTPLCSIG